MKKRNLKTLRLRKNAISSVGNTAKGGLVRITLIDDCGSQIDACPSALACTFQADCPLTIDLTCQTLNNKCETFNYPCQSLVECA
ncbi:hypothetical protein C8N46_101329 [Kordia periserrulae]|uniref:Uncharacterized protein n=1 Tax=Kordia periserrulae TaxID=701523 RepID=A0A2T6C613_9FLAO|nr:hypothetical protein [Kordia periserrulae]PTX63725.1 hypothetical protein C8N46_101329 [Kordia periserrulae]